MTPSGEVLKGFLEEVMKVLQAWKRLEVVSQKLDGAIRIVMACSLVDRYASNKPVTGM